MADTAQADTIAAVATAMTPGSIGIVRLSGPASLQIARAITGLEPAPRQAYFSHFLDAQGSPLDSGLLLYFPAPASYTGEEVVELQGHGGAIAPQMVLQRVLELGARPANPGEFTERAFLNHKLDLAQAEAVADLIASRSVAMARGAMNSLQGAFSLLVEELAQEILRVRMLTEAHIDFSDEELDSDWLERLNREVEAVLVNLDRVIEQAQQGRNLVEGSSVLLAGPPNVGKSSLLNAFTGMDSAIVTALPGTTRDVLRETVDFNGTPVLLLDTAGLRDSDDVVEQEGIRRTQAQLERADHVFLVQDASAFDVQQTNALISDLCETIDRERLTLVLNKADLCSPATFDRASLPWQGELFRVSAATGEGLKELRNHIEKLAGGAENSDSAFTARARHVQSLQRTREQILSALSAAQCGAGLEMVAEDLRLAHKFLGEITGLVSSDDLLGEIFAGFCIGK